MKHSSDIAYELMNLLKLESIKRVGEFSDAYVAGYLGSILKNLAQYPEVQRELQKEVERLKKF
jgi:hypothetical protein